jgi:hypothetical protein
MCIVRTGDVIKCNDPRYADRYVEVKTVRQIGVGVFAVYDAGQREARVNTDRIFNDNKSRKTGWQLISHGDQGLASGDGT